MKSYLLYATASLLLTSQSTFAFNYPILDSTYVPPVPLPDTPYAEFEVLPKEDQKIMCSEIGGWYMKKRCYTFDGTIMEERVMPDGTVYEEEIAMRDCPGGCAIWGVTCAPATWVTICKGAAQKEGQMA